MFSAYFPPAFLGGGALRSVAAIVSQSPGAYTVTVVTSDRDLGQKETLDVIANKALQWGGSIVYYVSRSFHRQVLAFNFARSLRPQIIYTNSFFDPLFSIVPLVMWAFGLLRPQYFVIAPRGEFGPSALKLKRAKKAIALRAFRVILGRRRVLWHASSPNEAANIRSQIGQSARIVIREDNTELPPTAAEPTQPGQELRAVIIGRVVPVKGIEELLQALAGVSTPLVLDIYGPEEDAEYSRRCRSLAAKLAPVAKVSFKGAIPSDQVRKTLRAYDLMLLPSHGENFSHVVAEALSVSVPVMCADVTPWSAYIANGGGVLVSDNEIHAWTASIQKYATMSPAHKKSNKVSAGSQYERWRASTAWEPHLFELIMATNR